MDAATEAAVSQLLGSSLELNVKVSKVLTLLLEKGVAYKAMLEPGAVLCHPDNRGGLMLNPFDVHSKGAVMLKVGCRLEALQDACCFELAQDSGARELQFLRNCELVENSNGLLCPVSRKERYLSVSCSHTVAFCRACLHGLTSPEESLQPNLGSVLAAKGAEHPFAVMCKNGWEWLVLPSDVEARFGELPQLLQQAMNTQQSVTKNMTEMEVAATIASYYSLLRQKGEQADVLKKATQQAEATQPQCAKYIDSIARWVELYAGGETFPLVKFLAVACKAWCGSIMIGEEFFRSLANAEFKGTAAPFLRAAFLMTQLTSTKVVDGVARLLLRSDVDRLRAAKAAGGLASAENVLKQGWAAYEDRCCI